MYCQKCRTPLKLDGSLAGLNPAAYDLLTAASAPPAQPPAPPPSTHASRISCPTDTERRGLLDRLTRAGPPPTTFKKQGGPMRGDGQARDGAAMSFVLLTESQVAPPRPAPPPETPSPKPRRSNPPPRGLLPGDGGAALPHEAERISRLFEILSARSDIDHPICFECTDLLVDGLQKRLASTTRERDAYVGFLKQVQADVPSEEDVAAGEKELAEARKAEEDALDALLGLEQQKAALDGELSALEDESRRLDADEEQFWRDRNAFATKLSEFQNERDSINSRFDHDSQLLTRLQRANVYNDTFSIHHDGNFATINGLRLGRLSQKPVDWPEINAAWGQALLLVVTVADKLGCAFQGYEPHPMGSTSQIIRYDYPSPSSSRLGGAAHRGGGPPPAPQKHVLELYSSGDLPLNLLWHRKFDTAMVAFLELVRQLGAFVHQQTKATGEGGSCASAPLTLPYKIEGDKIGGDRTGYFSIKLGIANDESWTKACKFALTCCKFLIAHASNVSHLANGRPGHQ